MRAATLLRRWLHDGWIVGMGLPAIAAETSPVDPATVSQCR
jgi:hypothetical protein